jgi:sugar/nucleoside kinase (ribokinase family)
VTVSVDAGTPIPALPQFLAQIDVLVTTKGQLRAVSGEEELARGIRAVQKRGPRTVVVTMGEHGCIGASGPQPVVRMPPFAVEVIDTTGAGDVFSGALAYALHRFPDLSMALRFASAAAALSCQGIGGRAACPTLDRVEAFLEVRSGADVP